MAGILLALRAGERLASPIGLACLVAMFGIFLLAILRLPVAWMDRLRSPTVLTCCSLACWLLAGMIAGGWQMMRLPQAIPADGADAELSGIVRKVDGRLDGRLRIWLQADRVHRGPDLVEGHVVRLSLAPESPLSKAGTYLRVKARIYPPPGRVLHGAPDHSLRALAAGVVASGYVISRRPAVAMPPDRLDWRVRLAAFRQRRADEIAAAMDRPAGGIAAALLIGDRRHVEQPVYDLFRGSGLAHLLAISGLHMGLLCFGAVGFVRAVAALVPAQASRFPVHKLAACFGMVAGFAYMLLSGMSVSAVRAWLMAMLVLAAWLLDRLGLTLRNVGIAAFVILLVSPLSLFTASMQLSFAATAALVIWFEGRRRFASEGRSRPRRWFGDLIAASLVAGGATMPLTAYHFGTVAPWGVLANLIGIPLTGLVIMPAGMAVLVTGALPGPQVIDNAALLIMQVGIDSLLAVNGWFASLPATPRRVAPPAPAMLMLLYGGMMVVLCLDMPAAARRVALSGIAAAAVAVSLFTPAPDGIYFARAKGGHLVLAGPQGEADTIPAGGRASARPLSPYLADNAARILAQSVPTGGSLTDGGPTGLRRHNHPAVGQVAIVTTRRRLTAGCRTGAAMVVTTVRADYPCRDGTPLVSLSGLPTGNYTLQITEGGITARTADGQYLRISPVRRP